MKITVYVATDKIGSRCEDEFECEEDLTDDEIEELAKDVMYNMMSWGWAKP